MENENPTEPKAKVSQVLKDLAKEASDIERETQTAKIKYLEWDGWLRQTREKLNQIDSLSDEEALKTVRHYLTARRKSRLWLGRYDDLTQRLDSLRSLL